MTHGHSKRNLKGTLPRLTPCYWLIMRDGRFFDRVDLPAGPCDDTRVKVMT